MSQTFSVTQMSPTEKKRVNLPQNWLTHLQSEFEKHYMKNLRSFLQKEKQAGKIIYPPMNQVFRAFHLCPLDRLKVVLLGQDPYHGPGQAHGLCFSVPKGVPWPPSLRNIFKELQDDLNIVAKSGDLTGWAQEGVLLLNATLTVEQGKPGSHQNRGWENFTDRVIKLINEKKEHVVFLLFGSFAIKKREFINLKKHACLFAAHPSPFSAHRGFFGSRPFSKTNQILQAWGIQPIDWSRGLL